MTTELLATRRPVIKKPEWLFPSWSVHQRFRVGTAEVYLGVHNSWRWESWAADGSMHMMVEGYETEELAIAASPCRKHTRLAHEELCRISFNPTYAWLVIDAATGEAWGRTGFNLMSDAELNARAWLKAGRPQHEGVAA